MPHQREQVRLLHHAAAKNHSLGRECAYPAGESQREIAGLECPTGMVGGQFSGGNSPAGLQSRTTGEAFEAILVKRAPARIGIGLQIVRNPDVPHLGVQQAMNDFAIDQRAAADAGSHGEVEDVSDAATGSPAGFAGRRGVHVGVEADRNVERLLQGSGKVEVLPLLLGGGSDVAEGRGFGMEIDGSERADADRAQVAWTSAHEKRRRPYLP